MLYRDSDGSLIISKDGEYFSATVRNGAIIKGDRTYPKQLVGGLTYDIAVALYNVVDAPDDTALSETPEPKPEPPKKRGGRPKKVSE